MRVVLREAAHAQQAVHDAGALVTIHGPEFRQAQGKFAVAAPAVLVDQNMARTVHRLQLVFRILHADGGEHVRAVKIQVAARLPQVEAGDVGREDQLISAAQQLLAEKIFDLLADEASLGMPEHQAGSSLVLDAEQVQFPAQAAVVALARFLHLSQVGVQILLGEERGPVDALQGVRSLVAHPMRARHAEQLEGLDAPGRGNVRTAAKIQKLAGAVSGKHRLRFFADKLALQELTLLLEELQPFFLRVVDALVREVRLRELSHLRFDLLEVVFCEGPFAMEIVEEAALGGRADAGMRVGKKFEDSRCQKVRR